MTPDDLIRRVIELAAENARSAAGGPFGALIVRNGEVVAEGVNLVTSTNDPTAHAEIVAIRKACVALGSFQLSGCELYTSCEPCPMCLGAIYWARPAAIYYSATHRDAALAGFDDSFIYRQMRLPVEDRAIPMHRVLADVGLEPFRVWAENLQRIPY